MRCFYLGLEPLKERYTEQLTGWVTSSLRDAGLEVVEVPGRPGDGAIRTGVVLDVAGRGEHAMAQANQLVAMILAGEVRDGDAIYLQDFWHPGVEHVAYAAQLRGCRPRWFAMVHAQSVDPFDFTAPMAPWMRHFELGLDELVLASGGALFCASTMHHAQMRAAGFRAPIHVIGLPLDPATLPTPAGHRARRVVSSSRLDAEKRPQFMVAVAERVLSADARATWAICTSAARLRSNAPGVLDLVARLRERHPGRVAVMVGLSKAEYYGLLGSSAVQFNCAAQDYVSWTYLEAAAMGCDVAYPNWHSFPECVDRLRLYHPHSVEHAAEVVAAALLMPRRHGWAVERCDVGRRLIGTAIATANPPGPERNVWMEGVGP